jgi:hypothetical protein
MAGTTLITTLHDSTGWSLESIKTFSEFFKDIYERLIVVATEGTNPTVIEALQNSGWIIISLRSRVGVEHISDSRRRVLRAGLESGSDYMHLVDMDRVLHWAQRFPDELREVAGRIPRHGFLIIGRTRRAFLTHPRNQTETEVLANKVFSLIYGREVDITAASRGISKEAAETILRYSRGRFFDTDSEWPTILLSKSKVEITYIETEGLEWETYLKRRTMTFPDGRRVDLREYYENNPESWVYRTMLAHRIARAALDTFRDLKES